MGSNKIALFQYNTSTISVIVEGLTDISTYIPYLTVKNRATDDASVLFKVGTIDGSVNLSFKLLTTDTSLAAKDYVYDITIIGNGNVLTLTKDAFIMIDVVYK